MKLVTKNALRVLSLLFLITATVTLTAQAQETRLQLGNLDKLEPKATESVDVTLDEKLLNIAFMFLDTKKPKEAAIKDLVGGLKGIYVRVLGFEKEGEYSTSDLDPLRTQLRAPAWSKMAGVKSKKEGESVEVYMNMTGTQIGGIAVIATEPKQLTVVNIVGMIDLEKLVKLSGKFGIPSIDININKDPKE